METVVLIPSLGRPASDFDLLRHALIEEGFNAVGIDPRPTFPGKPTLHDLAADTVAQLDALQIEQFHLVGHAFGNRLSRCITADFNHRVKSLTLLAAGEDLLNLRNISGPRSRPVMTKL
jgi:pimeloyl-ACP methyl ester carboxylesterase